MAGIRPGKVSLLPVQNPFHEGAINSGGNAAMMTNGDYDDAGYRFEILPTLEKALAAAKH